MTNNYILDLDRVVIHDINLVGGKNASLGEMLQHHFLCKVVGYRTDILHSAVIGL